MTARNLPLVLLCAAACSPSAPSPCPEGSAYGGATFVIWPPPSTSAGDQGDNPWLNGEAVGSGGTSAAGGSITSGASGPSGGAPGSLPPGASGAGGASGGEPPKLHPARLVLRAYVESTTAFKAALIEHVSGAPSGACSLELYSNGSAEVWRSLAVPSALTVGDRALLCVPDGAAPACTVGFGGSAYNGNDALVLRCDGQVLDTLGVVGVDPGKGWSGPGYDGQPISTVDHGLWRCDDTSAGVSAFDTADWMSWNWEGDVAWLGPTCPAPDLGAAGAPG